MDPGSPLPPPDPASGPVDDGEAGAEAELPPRKTPGPFLRIIVMIFGASMVAMGWTALTTGAIFGILIGLLLVLAGLAIAVIASGLVEWWAQRQRAG